MLRIIVTPFILLASLQFCFCQDAANSCTFHLVVLGSSTAAGTGPSSQDSAWVNRFRSYIQEMDEFAIVTNLAVGGTTTYHIMPDDFIAPGGRPATNTDKNISEAIRLGASAIIVNMPSNDAANNYTVEEQLFNFATIADSGGAVDIPVWTCTTQPRNFSNQNQIDNQIEVRDSVLAIYGDHALDFWNQIATVNGTIDPQFDSGDGVHLNDAGHAILFNRVKNKAIQEEGLSSLDGADLGIDYLDLIDFNRCGGPQYFEGLVVNYGIDQTSSSSIRHFIDGILIDSSEINPLGSCESAVFNFEIEINTAGQYQVSSSLQVPDTIDTENDTASIQFSIDDGPEIISAENDTVCNQATANFQIEGNNYDHLLWYKNSMSDDPIAQGENFTSGSLTKDSSFFFEAVLGELFYRNELFTTDETNRDYNGAMFDLIAFEDMTIDSLTVRITDTGTQTVKGFYNPKSFKGSENNQLHWTSWGLDTVDVDTEKAEYMVNFGSLELKAGDTTGIYIHMVDADARLSYQETADAMTFSNDELSIYTGTGITNIFRGNFFPRIWNGRFYYHYGFNPKGDCVSERMEVKAVVSMPTVDIGPDTSLFVGQTLEIEAELGFFRYEWDGVPGGRVFEFRPNVFQVGENIITLVVTDDHGCKATDMITITVLYPDWDEDGFNSEEDCNDFDADINPDALEIPDNNIDENCDGILGYSDIDEDGFDNTVDCDDNNANIYPGAPEIPNNGIDEDCDGVDFIIDDDNDGYNSDEDCDDSDPDINPGADEIPNNDIDEDCDGIAQIRDADMDGFNSDEDCDDFNSGIFPGAVEIPNNGIDEDCDGQDLTLMDNDNDGFNDDVDCDDTDPDINPNATEIPNNSIDENCDGIIEIIDEDMDGFHSDEDCDDANADINPGATEIPNNTVDEDCDGTALVIDDDNDGYNSDEDCDDSNASINPAALEIPNNSIDENCDGIIEIIDEDMDGFHSDEDCNDTDPDINPGALEIPNNGIDEDCDGIAQMIDEDNDGFNSDEDCDDSNPSINPGADEICDDADNNCNGQVDEGLTFTSYYADMDMDGYGDASTSTEFCVTPPNLVDNGLDCDDTNPNIYPGAPEIANNGIDEDCNGSDWILSSTTESELDQILVYPNPNANGIFYIEGLLDSDRIELYQATGYKLGVILIDYKFQIVVPGVYYLKVTRDQSQRTMLLVRI